ncbi:hypothetical protein GCM10020218_082760 [Dactylosporangium vinaceum]
MRDRTRVRNYSPANEEFRREHARHRDWGLAQRHAAKLRRLRDRAIQAPATAPTPQLTLAPVTPATTTTTAIAPAAPESEHQPPVELVTTVEPAPAAAPALTIELAPAIRPVLAAEFAPAAAPAPAVELPAPNAKLAATGKPTHASRALPEAAPAVEPALTREPTHVGRALPEVAPAVESALTGEPTHARRSSPKARAGCRVRANRLVRVRRTRPARGPLAAEFVAAGEIARIGAACPRACGAFCGSGRGYLGRPPLGHESVPAVEVSRR